MSDAAFLYSEARLAEGLGISRTEARSYRASLIEGDDWKKEHGEILLSHKGATRLSELAGKPSPFSPIPLPVAEKKNGAPKKMRVTLIPVNPRMVRAFDDDGAFHLVHVGNNATFVVGDVIDVGPHPTQKGILQLLSAVPRDRRRLPRQ